MHVPRFVEIIIGGRNNVWLLLLKARHFHLAGRNLPESCAKSPRHLNVAARDEVRARKARVFIKNRDASSWRRGN